MLSWNLIQLALQLWWAIVLHWSSPYVCKAHIRASHRKARLLKKINIAVIFNLFPIMNEIIIRLIGCVFYDFRFKNSKIIAPFRPYSQYFESMRWNRALKIYTRLKNFCIKNVELCNRSVVIVHRWKLICRLDGSWRTSSLMKLNSDAWSW